MKQRKYTAHLAPHYVQEINSLTRWERTKAFQAEIRAALKSPADLIPEVKRASTVWETNSPRPKLGAVSLVLPDGGIETLQNLLKEEGGMTASQVRKHYLFSLLWERHKARKAEKAKKAPKKELVLEKAKSLLEEAFLGPLKSQEEQIVEEHKAASAALKEEFDKKAAALEEERKAAVSALAKKFKGELDALAELIEEAKEELALIESLKNK